MVRVVWKIDDACQVLPGEAQAKAYVMMDPKGRGGEGSGGRGLLQKVSWREAGAWRKQWQVKEKRGTF